MNALMSFQKLERPQVSGQDSPLAGINASMSFRKLERSQVSGQEFPLTGINASMSFRKLERSQVSGQEFPLTGISASTAAPDPRAGASPAQAANGGGSAGRARREENRCSANY